MTTQYLQDYKKIIRLGLPIVAGQAGMILLGFADSIMVGQYSTEALASASFVNNLFNMANLAMLGFTYGITPLAGALFARGDSDGIGRVVRNGMLLNLLYCALLMGIMMVVYFNLHRLGQPQELLPLIRPYFLLTWAGLPALAIFNVLGQTCYGMRNTNTPMWIILGGNLFNILGNWLLIYGHWGCPEMGLTGAGISTLFCRLAGPVALVAYYFLAKSMHKVRLGIQGSRIQGWSLHKIWVTSFPVSMQLLFETAAFSVAAVMAGWLGKVELASFQVLLTLGTLGFGFYYSIGSATSVLVANEAGRGDRHAMRRVGWAGYHVTLAMALCSSLTFLLAGRYLIALFSHDPAVMAMSLSLIPPLLLYQLGDATQVNFANALRGTSKVMSMLWIALFSYIIIGLPVTYLVRHTIQGIFYSFSVSLFLAGSLFLYFFIKNTREKV